MCDAELGEETDAGHVGCHWERCGCFEGHRLRDAKAGEVVDEGVFGEGAMRGTQVVESSHTIAFLEVSDGGVG